MAGTNATADSVQTRFHLQLDYLSCDKQKEGSICRFRVALAAWPTAGLTVHPNSVIVTGAVGSIAPDVFSADRQSVGLNPSAPTVNCLHVLPEIDLIFARPYFAGLCSVATETARYRSI